MLTSRSGSKEEELIGSRQVITSIGYTYNCSHMIILLNFSGISYTSHTSIHPASSKIRFFDTSLLKTDSIIIKVIY